MTSRTIWNGAISFGLVNIPVALYPATKEVGLDFEWLDKRTMDPVGYKRINKKTGLEIEKEDIVKGLSYEDGRYVILTDDEIRRALAKSTQTIEIESFVNAAEIPLVYFERPYYLVPLGRGDKAYALLRETLLKTKRVGIARIVIHSKEHLAALVPSGTLLVLILLRWASQMRSGSVLNMPAEGSQPETLTERELSMAVQLVDAMSEPWEPDKFSDQFTAKVMATVQEKVKTGKIEERAQPEPEPSSGATANIIDITDLLRRSLQRRNAEHAKKTPAKAKAAVKHR
ncbi:MAG: Ku protein [Negativicutes bacterium]